MRFGIIRPFILAVMASILAAPAAQAQDLTIFAGGLLPGEVRFHDVPTSLDKSPIFGVRVSTGFAAALRLEHTLAFSNDLLFPSNQQGVTGARGFILNSNLLVNIPLGIAVPYATAGLGLISQFGSNNLPVGTKFAINYGGGLKFPKVLGPAGLRFDARGYTATGVFSRSMNMFEISAGLMFGF
jgi:hypothetical protein